MTQTADTAPTPAPAPAAGGSQRPLPPAVEPASHRRFVLSIILMMGMAAMSIDLMLPAFGRIRTAFGMEAGSAEVTWVITAFFLGMAIGPWFFGPPSDRFGRKPPLRIGIWLYVAAAVTAAVAPTFPVLVVARFFMGVGASAPRVLATAMVRDRYEGTAMARLMSNAMAVFMLVPILAPSLASLIMLVAPWRTVMWIPPVVGVAIAVFIRSLPETLAPEKRRAFTVRSVGGALKSVVTTREAVCFGLAVACLFGMMSGYLSSSEQILDQTYGYGDWFGPFFAAVAVMFALSQALSARLVVRYGLFPWIRRLTMAALCASAAFVALSVATDGEPPFWVLLPTLCLVMPTINSLVPNCNTAALVPLSHIAGTASAITGTVSTAAGAIIGNRLSDAFDGTTKPYAIGSFALVVAAVVLAQIGSRGRTARAGDR